MDKTIYFSSHKYMNVRVLDYFKSPNLVLLDLKRLVKDLKELNLSDEEITITLINYINYIKSSKIFMVTLDLINYFMSSIYGEKKKLYIEIFEKNIYTILATAKNEDLRSVTYQFVIDYSSLYNFSIDKIKKKFPIDKVILLKRISELATTKKYLVGFLAYELLNYFDEKEINNLWSTILSLKKDEQVFIFTVFNYFFSNENKKYLYEFVSKLEKKDKLKFIPYLKNYHKSKKLFLMNKINYSQEEWNEYSEVSFLYKIFFSQANIYFFSKTNSFLFISNFFSNGKYVFFIECDCNFNYISSKLFKQPLEFNISSYLDNKKIDFENSFSFKNIDPAPFFKLVLSNIKENIPKNLILLDYLLFSGNMFSTDIDYKEIELDILNYDEDFYKNIINKRIYELLPKNNEIFNKKFNSIEQIELFLNSPISKKSFNEVFNKNKKIILERINFFKKLSFSIFDEKIYSWLISLDKIIKLDDKYYLDIDLIKNLIKYYLIYKNKIK